MKKLSLTLLLFAICLTVFSQKFFIGGTFSLGTENEKTKGDNISVDGDKYFNFSFMPKAGYFLSDNIAIGGTLGFYNYVKTEPDKDKEKTSMFYLGPIARYYYKPNDNAGIFFEGSAIFGFGNEKYEDVQGTTTTITKNDAGEFSFGITPGIFINATKNISIEFSAGWLGFKNQYIKYDNTKDITNSFNFTISSSLQVGFTFNF